jgi:hypothetical protein
VDFSPNTTKPEPYHIIADGVFFQHPSLGIYPFVSFVKRQAFKPETPDRKKVTLVRLFTAKLPG